MNRFAHIVEAIVDDPRSSANPVEPPMSTENVGEHMDDMFNQTYEGSTRGFVAYDLRSRYSYWNAKVFGGQLPDIPIRWFALKNATGRIKAQRNRLTGKIDVVDIVISNVFNRADEKLDSVLLHEMCHCYVMHVLQLNDNHGGEFHRVRGMAEGKSGIKIMLTDEVTDEISEDISIPEYVVLLLDQGSKVWMQMVTRRGYESAWMYIKYKYPNFDSVAVLTSDKKLYFGHKVGRKYSTSWYVINKARMDEIIRGGMVLQRNAANENQLKVATTKNELEPTDWSGAPLSKMLGQENAENSEVGIPTGFMGRVAFGGSYWHGSDNPAIDRFRVDETKFALLGNGVYLYKKKESALRYGSHVYKVSVRGLKIAPNGFSFRDGEIEKLKVDLGIENTGVKYSGEYNPIWWGTDGWSLYGKDRKVVVAKMSNVMKIAGWDGMLAEYPNGGEVCVIWKGYERLEPVSYMGMVASHVVSSCVVADKLAGIMQRIAIDFTTQKAMDKYLKEYPGADRANHRVVETKPEEKGNEPSKKGWEHPGGMKMSLEVQTKIDELIKKNEGYYIQKPASKRTKNDKKLYEKWMHQQADIEYYANLLILDEQINNHKKADGEIFFPPVCDSNDDRKEWQDRSITPILERLAQEHGKTKEEVRGEIEKKANDILNKSDFAIKMPSEYFGSFLDSGKYQNVFATGHSSGGISDYKRKNAEAAQFGISTMATTEERPVYGYMDDGKIADIGYGDVKLVLKKDNVKDRTSITLGDSLMDFPVQPSKYGDVKLKSFHKDFTFDPYTQSSLKELLHNKVNSWVNDDMEWNYAEAQYHGGVTINDVANIVFVGDKPSADLTKRLDEKEIKWEWKQAKEKSPRELGRSSREAGLKEVLDKIVHRVRDSELVKRLTEKVTRYFQTKNPADDLTPQEIGMVYKRDEYGDEFDVPRGELDVSWSNHAEWRSDLRSIDPSRVNEAVRDYVESHPGSHERRKVNVIKPGVGKAVVDIDMGHEPENAQVITVMAGRKLCL